MRLPASSLRQRVSGAGTRLALPRRRTPVEVDLKSRQPKKEKAGRRGGRMQPARLERQGDTYRRKVHKVAAKLPDVTACPECGAVFRQGRWRWSQVKHPTGTRREQCPACRRIQDGYPAGEVTIRGNFARAHRAELLSRIRNLEERERSRRPLHRLMAIRESDDALVVTTTDANLAHAIGVALFQAYRGKLDAPWTEEGDLLRVRWER